MGTEAESEKVTPATSAFQGCQISHFMANFEKFGHFLTALAMKKRLWPFHKIWPYFWPFFQFLTVELSFHYMLSFCIFWTVFMSLIVTVTP